MRPPRGFLSAPPSTGGNTTAGPNGSSAIATDGASNQWGPFGNAATYGADMALALGILLSAFVLGLFLMVGVRFYLRRRRGAHPPPAGEQEKLGQNGDADGDKQVNEPMTVYAAGETELAGAVAECAICLTEFVEGDRLRVLPACRHGFHVECAEAWLASFRSCQPSSRRTAPSCPVCRASCRTPETSPESESSEQGGESEMRGV